MPLREVMTQKQKKTQNGLKELQKAMRFFYRKTTHVNNRCTELFFRQL